MKTIEKGFTEGGILDLSMPSPARLSRRHGHGSREASWQVTSATVAGVPAFLWRFRRGARDN